MALSERLAYILDFDVGGAVKGLEKVGSTADRELGKAEKKLDKVAGNLTKFGAGAVAFAGIAGAALVKTALSASDLEESVNAVKVTFGDAAAGILKLGEDAAHAVGLSNAEFNGLAVQFSSFATTVAGKGGDVVQTMEDLTGRAADFASVMNLDVAEAARVFQSGLAGETEPLKKFGIDLSAASVSAYAAANGIAEVGAKMTETEKVQARYGLLMEATVKTQGDFANTSDGYANSMRIFKADLANLSAEIGSGVLPALAKFAQAAIKVTGALSSLNEKTGGSVGKFAALGAAGIGLLGTLSLIAGQVIKMRDRFSVLDKDGTRSLNNMGKAAKGLGIALGIAAAALAVYQANQASNAKATQHSIDLFGEMARMADEDLSEALSNALLLGKLGSQDLDESMSNLAETNIEVARRLIATGTAAEAGEKVLKSLTAAVAAEEEARKTETATLEGYGDVLDETTEAVEDNTDAVDDAKRQQSAYVGFLKGRAVPALRDFSEGIAKVEEAQASLREEIDKSNTSMFDYEKQTLDLTSAAADYYDAAVEANDATANAGLTAEEAAQQKRDLRSEEIALAEKALSTAKAFADQSDAAAGSTTHARLQKDELLRLAEAMPGLRDEIALYIAELDRIPGVKQTIITTSRGGSSSAGGSGSREAQVRGASGGIVTRPTFALIGEAGPEAVIPLNRTPGSSPLPSGGMGGHTFVTNIDGNVYGVDHLQQILNERDRKLVAQLRQGRRG